MIQAWGDKPLEYADGTPRALMLAADPIHPTENGYRLIAEAFGRALLK